jgi:hypothetical protein
LRTIIPLLLAISAGALFGEELLLCGGAEVYLVRAGETEKLWTWRAKDHPELPPEIAKKFATTDDCRPVDGGKKVLVSSSSGAVALVERPSGKVLWYAQVPNAHGVEMLPHGKIVAASSTSAAGNRLLLFDKDRPDEVLWREELHSAHGVVWDAKRECLWALGYDELRKYALVNGGSEKPSLSLEAKFSLPDTDGHDLSSVPGTDELVVSAEHHVYVFSRNSEVFRLHPELGERAHVKGVNIHPDSGRTVFVQAEGKNWWAENLHFLSPDGSVAFPGATLYRPRWLNAPR